MTWLARPVGWVFDFIDATLTPAIGLALIVAGILLAIACLKTPGEKP